MHISSFKPFFLTLKGKLFEYKSPIVMGIINLNGDSFYTDSRAQTEDEVLKKVFDMNNHQVDMIDLGGASSRPGAKEISLEEELERVLPGVETIQKHFPELSISIDTYRAKVAKQALKAGAALINDITAGEGDADMFALIQEENIPYILMHKQGIPETMQNNPQYVDVVKEVYVYLYNRIRLLRQMGVNDIIADVGFGFGKTNHHNWMLLKNLEYFQRLEAPILTGVSRKSMINNILNIKSKDALNGTSIVNTMAILSGTQILRVHDVKEAKEAINLVDYYRATI